MSIGDTLSFRKVPISSFSPSLREGESKWGWLSVRNSPHMATHAVIRTGGKQYIVEPGETYRFERLDGKSGSPITFSDVLLTFSNGAADVRVGAPTVSGASVRGTITEQGRTRKLLVIKYKAKSRYRRKHGHRQHFTAVKVDTIEG